MSVFVLVEDVPTLRGQWEVVREHGLRPLLRRIQRSTTLPISVTVGRTTGRGLSDLSHFKNFETGLDNVSLDGVSYDRELDRDSLIVSLLQVIERLNIEIIQNAMECLHSLWTRAAERTSYLQIAPAIILGKGAKIPELEFFLTTALQLQGIQEDFQGEQEMLTNVRMAKMYSRDLQANEDLYCTEAALDPQQRPDSLTDTVDQPGSYFAQIAIQLEPQ
ncbi:hypothetical protein EV122DRAFT_256820 [Schizophyllum commune]